MTARIDLANDTAAYRPGEVVTGTAEWSYSAAPLTAFVRLSWRAEGRGSPDGRFVSTARFDGFRAADRRAFRLVLPTMPYSFSGSVLSIVWRVELVVRHRRLGREKVETSRIVTMSPTGDPIDPYRR